MLCVEIDELTPCLRNSETGDLVETEVLKISRKSFLKKFNKNNGWYTNWENLVKEGNDVYALVLKGTVDIQGLVAIKDVEDYDAVYISWAVASPSNNKLQCSIPKYLGVGGHLFAIAIDKSIEYGHNGVVTGFASNETLVEHYKSKFGAVHIGALHPYHIVIEEEQAKEIKEVYSYEWSDDEL